MLINSNSEMVISQLHTLSKYQSTCSRSYHHLTLLYTIGVIYRADRINKKIWKWKEKKDEFSFLDIREKKKFFAAQRQFSFFIISSYSIWKVKSREAQKNSLFVTNVIISRGQRDEKLDEKFFMLHLLLFSREPSSEEL
jgi:viroplasmin and RNaseH domain-containing protein